MAAWDPSAALFDSLQVLGESIPGFQCDFGAHGVGSIDLTTPFTQFNGVVTRTLRPSVEHLRKWAESYSASARPWSIQLRGHPTDEVLALAQSYGLTERHREPLMVLPVRLLPSSAPERPSAQVTCVGGEASAEYEQALTHGSGAPEGSLAAISSAQVLDHPKISAYLARDCGRAVATGMTTLAGSTLGVLNMSTLVGERGRGHARQLLQRMLADGVGAGATRAVLQSSADGLALYRSVGFTTEETWTYLVAPD